MPEREGKILKDGDKYIIKYIKRFGRNKFKEKQVDVSEFDIRDEHEGKKCWVSFDKSGKVERIKVEGKDIPSKNKKKTIQKEKIRGSTQVGQTTDSESTEREYLAHNFIKKLSMTKIVPLDNIKLPSDVRNLPNLTIENFALHLYKFAQEEEGKFHFYKGGSLIVPANFSNIDFSALTNNYYSKRTEARFKNRFASFNLKTSWRLVVGLGGASVYETSMTLHHIYGFPYIPASAVKGVFRNWVISEIFDLNEKKALQDSVFRTIFGSPEEKSINVSSSKGWVIFFDAFPINEPKIDADVMNPHYSPYYSDTRGRTPPADYHNPIPVYFLTVKDTTFNFMIAVRKNISLTEDSILIEKYRKCSKNNTNNPNLLDVAECLLKSALKEHGIGEKTSVGYGYMTEQEEQKK